MRQIKYQKSVEIYLGIIAFVICVFPKLVPLTIIGLLICTILGYAKKKITLNITAPAVLLAVLYLIYLIGTIFSQNQYLSNLYIENKLTFIIFPLLLSFRFKESMDFRPSVAGIILGVTVASVMGMVNAWNCHNGPVEIGAFSCFTSVNISHIHHPSYFSVYLLIAVFAAWTGYFKQWKSFTLFWILPFSALALIMYGLCLSLAGYLFLMILAFIVLLYFVRRRFGKKAFFVFLIASPALATIIFAAIPQIKSQFVASRTVFLEYSKDPEKFVREQTGHKQGDATRVIMWTVSSYEFGEHLWGVGTGNVDRQLSNRLKSYGQYELAKMDEKQTIQYNPHSQFLQTALEIGIEGLIVLLLIIFTAIRFAIRHKNWILLVLIGSLFFNSLFESMLQRQSGIVFYAFWICLLIVYSSSRTSASEVSANKINQN